MRFVLVKGESQYGSLRLHIDQLGQALSALGAKAEIVDLVAADSGSSLEQALSQPTDCLFGFSGVGSDLAISGRFFERAPFVYASLYVDHPVHHLQRLSANIARHVALFLDHSHVRFVEQWAPPGAFAHIGFLPPGANTLDAPAAAADEAFERRDIPVLFTGTYRGAPIEAWRDWPESPAKTLSAGISRRMAADGRLALLDAFGATLSQLGAALTPELLRNAAPLFSAIQLHAEAFHRHRVLTALGEADAPLTVYGNGWEPICARHPSFQFGGVGSFEETLHLLRRARVVLNINNGFVAGGHERVFTAMHAGAAVFSEQSAYYAEVFRDGVDLVTYDVNQPGHIAAALAALTGDITAQAAIARAGQARAVAEHSWTNRAAELIKVIQAAR